VSPNLTRLGSPDSLLAVQQFADTVQQHAEVIRLPNGVIGARPTGQEILACTGDHTPRRDQKDGEVLEVAPIDIFLEKAGHALRVPLDVDVGIGPTWKDAKS
jgi:hypothetical protein